MRIESTTLPENRKLAQGVAALAREAEQADGIAPLSEQFLLGLEDTRLGHRHLVASAGETLLGAAACDGDQVEMVVHPEHRRAGVGQALYDALSSHTSLTSPQLWAHGNLPGAQALATKNGLEVVRTLLVMAIEGADLQKAAELPTVEGMEILNYAESVERWGRERVEAEWLRVNNEAFSWHPEQGGWDMERLHRGMEAEWFDPQDLIFLWEAEGASAGDKTAGDKAAGESPRLAGFHWTKWHGGFGEVYVVGLGSDFRGRGLGAPLLSAGLNRMQSKGAERVILYVEEDNAPAVKAYERLGFQIAESHCVWAKRD
ncbi:mycothiol synthase [Corynebacterium sp.]|uniref:mycothiol synthase n=1 Tax=Corynebacterium sp. TaxID=1720 RepID=UPI0026DC43B3|nr:mycothiol synthase [Corynebacterium sp.]MDO5032456.1 mycothiol synthase [Corynebacterium sp.]